jgi:hypothetical protein
VVHSSSLYNRIGRFSATQQRKLFLDGINCSRPEKAYCLSGRVS